MTRGEATVRDLYAAFNRIDVAGMLARLEPEIRWYTLDLTLQPQLYVGHAEVGRFLTEVLEARRSLTADPEEVVTLDRQVLARIRHRPRGAPARPGTGFPVTHLWTVGDSGLLVRHRLYLSADKAQKVMHARAA